VSHEAADGREAVPIHGAPDLGDAACIRGELGAQVGDVLIRIARRVWGIGELCSQLGLVEHAAPDEREVLEQDAFLFDEGAEGRHGAGRVAADVGVMRARGDEEIRVGPTAHEDGRDDRHVRQVRAAVIGAVEEPRVPGLHRAPMGSDDRGHTCAHRAQVHRHVRCVRDQPAFLVEECARVIEALLDVH
jgi:hypothetical protein